MDGSTSAAAPCRKATWIARAPCSKKLCLSPDLARAHFFYAKVLRSDGNYDEAADHLRKLSRSILGSRCAERSRDASVSPAQICGRRENRCNQVLAVDPEDLQAHYNLMLCYNGLGDEKQAHEHQVRYLRFKADESAQAITGRIAS